MNSLPRLLLFGATAIILTGCKAPVEASAGVKTAKSGGDEQAVAFLKRSMDVYAAMPSFKAECTFAMGAKGATMPSSTRTIAYQRPNLFRIVSSNPMGFVQTSVSDGKSVLEFDNMTGQPPRKEAAPGAITKASSMQMKHPMFCGSLLYQFFGGSANYAGLVDDSKVEVTLGSEEQSNGETAQVVKFYGREQYGHVEALIGKQTGYVYRIRYDSEPLLEMMRKPETMKALRTVAESAAKRTDNPAAKAGMEAALATPPTDYSLMSEETYAKPSSPATLPAETFTASPPKGVQPIDMSKLRGPTSEPPVPLGSPAPDFAVTGLDGKTVRLSAMRGKPVLLDFWATWCGPCVAALPHTQEIFEKGKGLQVLAISDEDKATVAKFIEEKDYSFPTALDTKGEAGRAYKTVAIPTTVIIDAGGKLVAYIVGGGQDAAIAEALAKVGIKSK